MNLRAIINPPDIRTACRTNPYRQKIMSAARTLLGGSFPVDLGDFQRLLWQSLSKLSEVESKGFPF